MNEGRKGGRMEGWKKGWKKRKKKNMERRKTLLSARKLIHGMKSSISLFLFF